jgi:folylpolyglutamate synthase/dihydropteroate synthase
MQRIYQERLPPEERSEELLNPHVDQSIDEFALSMRGRHHQLALSYRSKATTRSGQVQLLNSTQSGLASGSNGDQSCCAFCSAIISAGHETGTSTVCN